MRTVTLVIPMPYDGGSLSKNRLFHRGDRRAGMNDVAKAWKRTLADSILPALWEAGWRHEKLTPPVHVEISGAFRDRNHAPDLSNLRELVDDAVKEGLGIDDKHFTTATGPAQYGVAIPTITISVTVGVEE